MDTRAVKLSRKQLGKFIQSPETIVAFENLAGNSDDLATVVSGLQGAPLLTAEPSLDFAKSRSLVAEDGIDAAPTPGKLTLTLTDTGVVAGPYGSDKKTLAIEVDEKGRIIGVTEYALGSDNVAEGAANLYFTQGRARGSIGAGDGLDYDPATGLMSLEFPYATGNWSPTLAAASGTISSYTATGIYTRVGRLVTATVNALITANGTGAQGVNVSLPFPAGAGTNHYGSGRETALSFAQLQISVTGGTSNAVCLTYNNGYPGGTGARIQFTITYMV